MKRRHQSNEISRHPRRYDKRTGKFIVNIRYRAATETTQRTLAVAEAFGLGIDRSQKLTIYDNTRLKIDPTDIVYITGESGSGKSALLRTLEKDIRDNPQLGSSINIADIQPDPNKPIIDTVGKTIKQSLELLSRVGLNDAFLFLRRYRELSDGQKYRYRIAKLIEADTQYWIMDEFAATLDRDTAKIVAYNVQKLARQHKKAAIIATTHTDLKEDLKPSTHIQKGLGKAIHVRYNPNEPAKECTILKQIQIQEGTRQDYKALAEFHYRSHNVGAVRKIFKAARNSETCGIIVYTYPAISLAARRNTMPKMSIKELNQKLSNIMRVVVHPKYRTIGLGQKLVKETLTKCGTPNVETTAVMAQYNPFFEKAGMTKIQQTTPPKQAVAIQKELAKLGFNPTLLSSEKHTTTKLKQLTEQRLLTLKQAFTKNAHPRFLKEFFPNQAYGRRNEYNEKLQAASQKALAKLIKITAQLLQTKAYLFWRNPCSNN